MLTFDVDGEPAVFLADALHVGLAMSRERADRKIACGEIRGGRLDGRVYIFAEELERLKQPAQVVATIKAEAAERRAAALVEAAARKERIASMSLGGGI